MKRLLTLLIIAGTVLTSCSKDDDNPKPKSQVKATIEGVEITFNTVNVELYHYPQEGYTDVEVTASVNNDPTRLITFIVKRNVVGPHASWYFSYFENATAFPKVEGEFSTVVNENTQTTLKGTFSGTVRSVGNPVEENRTLANGTFDITYNQN